MKAKVKVSGTDGNKHYEPGDECVNDSVWLRRLLVNGLATPLDDDAKAVCAHPAARAQYRSIALIESAVGSGVKPRDIPAWTE